MNIDLSAFDQVHLLGESATHPLALPVERLALYPQGVGRIRKAAEAATTPLSLLVAGPGLPPRRFAPDSGVVGGFAALRIRRPPCGDTRPDAPSGASNYGF